MTTLIALIFIERIVVFLRFLCGEYRTKSEFLCLLLIPFVSTVVDVFNAVMYTANYAAYNKSSFIEFVKERFNKLK